jgi:hypothetical protein
LTQKPKKKLGPLHSFFNQGIFTKFEPEKHDFDLCKGFFTGKFDKILQILKKFSARLARFVQ